MGATNFTTTVEVKTDVKTAFHDAKESAAWENGHGGYTGTIAEKGSFINMGTAADIDSAYKKAQDFMDADDARISDKWGPAGAITFPHKGKNYVIFFGWASE
jgi:hypothetical protein